MGKKKPAAGPTPEQMQRNVYGQANTAYQGTTQPSANEEEMGGVARGMMGNYNTAVGQDKEAYGNIMGSYQNFLKGFNPKAQQINYQRPGELNEAFGFMREAAPGYREFAQTGGYSPADVQELRARGMAPIRSAYGNTMMEMDRSRALGGGAANYIAASSKAQRELPGQMADAMTGVNAQLAQDVRQGRLAGLGGLTQLGGQMGGLAGDDASRMLQSQMANQGADLQAQQMGMTGRLGAMGGMSSLYGTTPGMSSMFGNQALNAYGQRSQMEQARNQFGLGLLDAQMRAGTNTAEQAKTPWWKTALSVAGTVAPYVALAASSRTVKHDIKPVKDTSKFAKYLKELPLYTWKYNGDDTTHFGPIAEEFQEKFGLGDGKTLHLADVMGVMLAAGKEAVSDASSK